jgi:Helix-turn-helix domain
MVELLTKEDFKALDEKMDRILEALSAKEKSEPGEWLKSAEVKAILNCSDATLKNYRDAGSLPYSKIEGTYYYSAKCVSAMLEQNSQKKQTSPNGN